MKNLFGEEDILALSLKQPYADLMLKGKIETRTWSTSYRGLVLICASLQPYNFSHLMGISGEWQMDRMQKILSPLMLDNGNSKRRNFYLDNWRDLFQKGVAIAVGRLVDCRLMTKEDEDKCFVKYCEPWIEEHENKKTGKVKLVEKQLWCHIYEDVKAIELFPWKGSQGWTRVTEEQKSKIVYI